MANRGSILTASEPAVSVRAPALLERPDAGVLDVLFLVDHGGEDDRNVALVSHLEQRPLAPRSGCRDWRRAACEESVKPLIMSMMISAGRSPKPILMPKPRWRKNSSSSLPLVTFGAPSSQFSAPGRQVSQREAFTHAPVICEQSRARKGRVRGMTGGTRERPW